MTLTRSWMVRLRDVFAGGWVAEIGEGRPMSREATETGSGEIGPGRAVAVETVAVETVGDEKIGDEDYAGDSAPPSWLRFVALASASGGLTFGSAGLLLAVNGWHKPALAFSIGAVGRVSARMP